MVVRHVPASPYGWLASAMYDGSVRASADDGSSRAAAYHSLFLCVQITEYPSPELPADRFSPDLCDLVARCLEKDPKQRPTAEQLLRHPFIVRYRHVGDAEVAALLQVRRREAGEGAGAYHESVVCVTCLPPDESCCTTLRDHG